VVKFWLRSNTIANSESSILLDIPAPIHGWPWKTLLNCRCWVGRYFY
jgi:hypothetical protein